MSKKEKTVDYGAELENLYERWNHLYEHGGSDPFWSDGTNLSLLRTQIINCKRKIEEQNTMFLLPDVYYRNIPPEVPRDYMARPDEIRENARKAMAIIDADENLKFVREQSKNLSEKQLKRLCIPAIIGYADNIRRAIAEDDLITMRRYERPDGYLDSFRSAAEKLHSLVIFERENEQLPVYEIEDEEEFEEDFGEEYSETEQFETEEITESINEPEEDFQLNFFKTIGGINMKVVMVEPNKPAYVTEIGDDYQSLHDAVGGLIEPIYYLDDPNAVMVGNEEAKIIGLEGNRRFGDRIVAGTFFICGDGGEDFCSLTDEQCEKYVREFAEPHEITQDEVQQDMGFMIIGL